ncbi:MAG TPA: EVE domain-containing protein [Verrucomicrobiae bacterium]|nr:EVE domain-containing protein [Verrucomicrobiae bacterium]
MGAKERGFHKAMLSIYEKSRDQIGYRPSRFLAKVRRDGGLSSAKYWLKRPVVSKGFERLRTAGKLNLSVEALVLKPEYKKLFTDAEREIALQRLKDHGWHQEEEPRKEKQVTSRCFWIFQAIPKQYDLKKELRLRKIDHWLVRHFRGLMKPGDKVIFWQAGKESGIYGVGELTDKPYLDENSDWRVETVYTSHLNPPLLKKQLLKDSVLKNLRILKPPFQGTNFKATKEQWNALGVIDDIFHADEIEAAQRFAEGATVQRTVNAYERNPHAKRVCLDHYGYKCSVCLINYAEKYGEIGHACIHVHHLKMLSGIGREYDVDPIIDLRPVCPNCHAMIHSRSPMMSIDELRDLVLKNSLLK